MGVRHNGWRGAGLALVALASGVLLGTLLVGGLGARAAQPAPGAATTIPGWMNPTGAGPMMGGAGNGRGMLGNGQAAGMMGNRAPARSAVPTPAAGAPGATDANRGWWGMMDLDDMARMMEYTPTVDSNIPFDEGFLNVMIRHQEMAVQAAQVLIADSARPELRDLAQRIITGQQREIDQMTAWRQAWYPDATASGGYGCGMMGNGAGGMMGAGAMRGHLGVGVDRDRMFLEMMIPHHEAAIRMAQAALQQATHPEIKTLAQQILTTQQAEISEMQTDLRQWYGATNP